MATISKAVIMPKPNALLEVVDLEVPSLKPNEILVKASKIAVNPVDWKIQAYGFNFVKSYPHVLGTDVAGTIVSVGSSVTRFQPGQRVTGFANSVFGFGNAHGAFQTHVVLQSENTALIPDSVSDAAASALPMAVATAGLALWDNLNLPRPSKGRAAVSQEEEKKGQAILVWGGSSSIGAAAVQIAKAAGYSVYTTASERHAEWLQKIGAKDVFDYRGADMFDQITKAAKRDGLKIVGAMDAISEGEGEAHTSVMTAKIVKESNGSGTVSTALKWPEDVEELPGIKLALLMAAVVGTDKKEFGTWLFNDWLEDALKEGTFVPGVELKVVKGGVEKFQELMDELKNGVSGKKLILSLE